MRPWLTVLTAAHVFVCIVFVDAGSHVLGPAARARAADAEERRELESTVDAALKRQEEEAYRAAAAARAASSAAAGGGGARAPPAWVYDAAAGYHRDAVSGFMFDPKSKLYFDPARRAWGPTGPGEGACAM
jgi:hypothetical protein